MYNPSRWSHNQHITVYWYMYTHTRLTALFPGLPRWASSRKVKPIWILLKQETVSGSCISWAICKSAPRSRQITTPAPHHSVFYRPDALPAAQPTASKHWRQEATIPVNNIPEWDEHKYKTLWSVILGHMSENISVSGEICSQLYVQYWNMLLQLYNWSIAESRSHDPDRSQWEYSLISSASDTVVSLPFCVACCKL